MNLIKFVFFFLGLLIFYLLIIAMFDFATKRELSAFEFACALLSFSLAVFIPLVTYSAIVCSLSFLFQKEEISFYFSLPIKRLYVFLIKFWQVYFHSSWMVFLGYLTFLIAFKNYFKVSAFIYLYGIFAGLLFLIIPVSISVIIVLIISRFIPFVKAKGVLTAIGLLVSSIILLFIRMMEPENLITPQGKLRFLTFMDDLHQPWMTIFPSEWLTNILAALYQNELAAIWINFIFLLVVALILLILACIVAQVSYVKIWAESLTVPEGVTKKPVWQMLLRIFPPDIRPLIKKDLLNFYRNIVERGSLLILLPLGAIYFFSLNVLHRRAFDEFFSFLFIFAFNLIYSAVVLCGLAGRWVFPSISQEGNNFNLIKVSSTSLKQFLGAKFCLGFLPIFLLGEILGVGAGFMLGWHNGYLLLIYFMEVLLALGITLIAIILGVRLADFSIKEPLEFALSYQGFIYIVWSMVFVGLAVFLIIPPLFCFLSQRIWPFFIISSLFSLAVLILISYRFYRAYNYTTIYLRNTSLTS